MARARITKQKLMNKEFHKAQEKASKIKTINGRRLTEGEPFYQVEKGVQILEKSGFTVFQNNYASQSECALSLLACLDVSLVETDKNYSLLLTQTNETEIDMETFEIKYTKNSKSDPDDKFPNVNDPFYELDTAPPILSRQKRTQLLRAAEPNLIQFAADIVSTTTRTGITGMKQFAVAEREVSYIAQMKYKHRTNMPSQSTRRGRPTITLLYEDDEEGFASRVEATAGDPPDLDFASRVEELTNGMPSSFGSKRNTEWQEKKNDFASRVEGLAGDPPDLDSKIKRSPKRKGKGY